MPARDRAAGPVGPAAVQWDSMSGKLIGPATADKPLPIWDKKPAADGPPAYRDGVAEMRKALDLLDKRLDGKASVEAALAEGLRHDRTAVRLLSIYSFGAVDAPGLLLDVLADEDPKDAPDRDAAVFALRRWLARDAGNGKRLFDRKGDTGLLLDKKYRPSEAETVLELLHDLPADDVRKAETYDRLGAYLDNDRMAIRQLAWWHLQRLAVARGVKAPAYDPAGEAKQRRDAAAWWQKQAADGKLPPSSGDK
jgi:hypothetical protein